MIITSVKLKNFGIHRELSFEPNEASVVGLLGQNGKGKSTVLKGIEFAFTGGLDDNASTYIRRGEKRAEVEVAFIKNGRKGSIYRKITPTTSTRELQWEGEEKPKTRSAEVDALLAEILGADKQAVANAVFLAQGSLDKILFGDQTDREKLFTRLVNISHIEKVSRVLKGKIAALAGGLEDLSVLRDEINTSLATAEDNLRRLDLELRSKPDRLYQVSWLERRLALDRSVAGLSATLERTSGAHALAEHQLKSQLEIHRAESAEVLEQRADLQQQMLARAREDLNQMDQGLLRRQVLEQNRGFARQLTERLTTTRARVEALKPLAGTDITGLKISIAQEHARQKSEITGRDLTQRVQLVTSHLQGVMNEPMIDERTVTALATEKDAHHRAISELDLTIKTLSATIEAKAAALAQGCNCPVCERAIEPDLIRPERLQKLQERRAELATQFGQLHARHRELTEAKSDRDSRYKHWAEELTRVVTAQGKWREEHAKFPAVLDLAALEAQCQQVEAALTEIRTLTANEAVDMRQLAEVNRKLAAEQQFDLSGFTEEKRRPMLDLVNRLELQQKQAQTAWLTVKPMVAQTLRMSGEVKTLQQQLQEARTTLEDVNRTRPADLLEPDETFEAVLKVIQQYQIERQQLSGQLIQVREQVEMLRRRQVELRQREETTLARRRAVEDLRQVDEALERGGLPMMYVTYRFQQLVELTQRNLGLLEANFTVALDPERPVSFRFTPLDDPGVEDMPQSKLSGGQRVRLAVAFLLSVQQLLMPELGLLVLDEPSTHLDAEGVESLKELLLNMSQTLHNAQHQVWIVDHQPALEPALGACLRVGLQN